ncbi:MAG: ribbon-helix-helix protein, CopG family [Candidatus Bathyarchaeota archaeon]|nr:ribbon-helix-helix protein, CopG family [Candidatus Bathyarchaeota archaeon]
MKQRNVKISISLDPKILMMIEMEAKRENRSRSNYIETVIKRHLDKLDPPPTRQPPRRAP